MCAFGQNIRLRYPNDGLARCTFSRVFSIGDGLRLFGCALMDVLVIGDCARLDANQSTNEQMALKVL